jgi:UDP-2,4-diacetamido-2,4,6-trideoxy-beta-L-altropyranose hydrolase
MAHVSQRRGLSVSVRLARIRNKHGRVRQVFVFAGGSDIAGITVKALRALLMLERPELGVDVAVGLSNPRKKEISRLCGMLPLAEMHVNTDGIARLMARADIAIGAGGTATWERCCLGLPSIVIAAAENQMEIARSLGGKNIHFYLGGHEKISAGDIKEAFALLSADADRRVLLSQNGKRLIDGAGAKRVAGAMLQLKDELVKAV